MPSKSTTPIMFRISTEALVVVKRRIKGKRSRWKTVGEYLRYRLTYDLTRKHHKREVRDNAK